MSKPRMIIRQLTATGGIIVYPEDGGRAVKWAFGILLFSAALVIVPLAILALIVLLTILLATLL